MLLAVAELLVPVLTLGDLGAAGFRLPRTPVCWGYSAKESWHTPANRAFAPIVFRLGSRPDCFLMDRFPGRHATDQLFDLREPLLLQDAGRDRGPISSRAMYGERPIFG